jgi:hypothetical protein
MPIVVTRLRRFWAGPAGWLAIAVLVCAAIHETAGWSWGRSGATGFVIGVLGLWLSLPPNGGRGRGDIPVREEPPDDHDQQPRN